MPPGSSEGGVDSAWDASCSSASGQTGCYFSACAVNGTSPEIIVFVVTDALVAPDLHIPDDYQPYLTDAIDNIRTEYPSVQQIILQTVIGGPRHSTCYCAGASCFSTPVATPVRASVNHPVIDAAIAIWLAAHPNQPDVVRGMSPEVDDCNQYADPTGHLGSSARCALADKIAAFYNPVGNDP